MAEALRREELTLRASVSPRRRWPAALCGAIAIVLPKCPLCALAILGIAGGGFMTSGVAHSAMRVATVVLVIAALIFAWRVGGRRAAMVAALGAVVVIIGKLTLGSLGVALLGAIVVALAVVRRPAARTCCAQAHDA